MPRRARTWVRRHPWISGIVGFVVVLLVVAHIVGFAIAEPLRREAEKRMNGALNGYKVAIGGLSLNIFGLGVDLLNVKVVQTAHPKPPIAQVERFGASIQWEALLSGKIVGDLVFDQPHVFLNLTQARSETADKKDLADRGWQEAVERIYPLKINALQIRNGDVTYDDGSKLAPIHVTDVDFLAKNIRNAASREGTFPSPISLDADVFDTGHVSFDGAADFLAKPHAAVRGDFALKTMPLAPLTPIARQYAVHMSGGTLSVDGNAEITAKTRKIDLANVAIDGIKADFVKEGSAGVRGEQVADKVVRSATDPEPAPEAIVKVEKFRLTKGELGYVDGEADPRYRLFLTDLDVTVKDFSNQKKWQKPGSAAIKGKFMGTGSMRLDATFQPADTRAEFTTDLAIENVDMVPMNDLLRARGGFDVKAGSFSMYSQITVKDGRVDGYVKPLFSNLDVYDRRQDSDKNIFQQAYEGIVGGISTLLENRPRDEVATVADLSGRIESPETSTWDVIIGLIQNAFVQAILPGLGREAKS